MIPKMITIQKDYRFFLFGPRGTGNSTWIEATFKGENVLYLDLLNPKEEALFSADPDELVRRTKHLPKKSWIVIDEVQKVPAILDLVQMNGKSINFTKIGRDVNVEPNGS